MELIEIDDPLVQLGAPLWLVDGRVEELNVGVEGELVHGVDPAHVIEDEEENGGTLGTGPVTLKCAGENTFFLLGSVPQILGFC